METNYKRTVAGSVGAGMGAIFNASGRKYYILEHKTESLYHHAGESQKIIVDQVELGRDSSCQVRFDESFETVSRRHAAIVKEGEGWKIIALSQTNPTFVNGQPIQGEYVLNSGDEIRLSSKGPLMGFIVPQGKQSLVSSIGLTERMSLFRKQALRPYKTAIWIITIILILAVAGLVTWNILMSKSYDEQLKDKQAQIETVQSQIEESDVLIDRLTEDLIKAEQTNKANAKAIREELQKAEAERAKLNQQKKELQNAVVDLMIENEVNKDEIDQLKAKNAEQEAKETKKQEERASLIEDIISSQKKADPVIIH